MENRETTLSSEKSLEIISEMINRTKMNIRHGAFHLLFWGWLVALLSLSEYFLDRFTTFGHPWWVWGLTIPGIFVSMIYGYRQGSRQAVQSYTERIYKWIWLAFIVALSTLFVFLGVNEMMHKVGPFILLFAAFAVFLSGIVIKFKPLIFGAICIWVFSVFGIFAGPSIAPLAVPAAVITGYLVPGYMLKNSETKNGKV